MDLLLPAALLLLLAACIVVPILSLLRAKQQIRSLEQRMAGVEGALRRLLGEAPASGPPPEVPLVETAPSLPPSEPLEAVIGRRWLGWIAVVLIFFAAAFFLKYAFENRWIGEAGRVALGLFAGLVFTWAGYDRHRRGWRYFSRVLTGGGVTLIYLSTYGAFAYYRLIDQRTAFLFLVAVVAGAHLLALAYDARSIAMIGLLGGLLTPVLLSAGRDQHRVLFAYLAALDLGVLTLVVLRRWRWVASLAFAGTHLLFWVWFDQHYHEEKRDIVLVFHGGVFLLFVAADLASQVRRQAGGVEQWIRSLANPFVFFATCHYLLWSDCRPWMGGFALTLAGGYALLAWVQMQHLACDHRSLIVTVGTALTFLTVAIPIQFEANWVTIGWSVEALVLVWVASVPGNDAAAGPLRVVSTLVFALAVGRHLLHDTPWGYRAPFTPIANRYFLGALAVTATLAAAAYLYRPAGPRAALTALLIAAGVFWISSSIETYSYFTAGRLVPRARHDQWAGQMALSLLWSAYAAALVAAGFLRGIKALRSAGLALFGLTLTKVVFIDMAELEQFYRIVAVLALGLVLLGVAWAYQRMTA